VSGAGKASYCIRRARRDEAGPLTALALRSKAHWGYDADFMARAVPELTVPPAAMTAHEVWVLEDAAGGGVGFHRVIPGDPAVLEDLWLEPHAIGRGLGRILWRHAASVARAGGARAMEFDAEPYALGFYERMGAVQIGATPSRIVPGRVLPRMRLDLGGEPG
jgi:GNAT superfamily N-acetyltransferase